MFHVFVEGAKDKSAAGVKRLAEAIAAHYGLPAADIEKRFVSGRFRVKGNCDRATAEQYKGDLEVLGAICTIEAATARNSYPTPPAGMPAVRPQPSSALATPPSGVAVSRTATPLPDAPARSSQQQFASGLSAAFSGDMPAASLGALENAGSSLSLSSVDGTDDGGAAEPAQASYAPPDAASLPASIGPAPDKPKPAEKKARPKDEPVDLFMPPDAAEADLKVDLHGDEVERSASKRASTPPPMDSAPPQRRSQPSLQVPNVGATAVAAKPAHPLGDERVRLVAGIVLAIVIGFIPAHLVASMREKSAYRDVDAKVTEIQAEATTLDDWNRLDQTRADLMSSKKSSQRSIAIMALAIWGVIGAGVAYGWFRRINWERFES